MKPQWQRRQERAEVTEVRTLSGKVKTFRHDPQPRHKMPVVKR